MSKPQTEIIRPKDTLCVCVSMPASADLGFLDERTLNCLVLEWSRCAGCDGCRVPACKRCIPNCKRELMCVFVCVCVCVCVATHIGVVACAVRTVVLTGGLLMIHSLGYWYAHMTMHTSECPFTTSLYY